MGSPFNLVARFQHLYYCHQQYCTFLVIPKRLVFWPNQSLPEVPGSQREKMLYPKVKQTIQSLHGMQCKVRREYLGVTNCCQLSLNILCIKIRRLATGLNTSHYFVSHFTYIYQQMYHFLATVNSVGLLSKLKAKNL